jgi:thiol-disulfide isomerase/thioredoxin
MRNVWLTFGSTILAVCCCGMVAAQGPGGPPAGPGVPGPGAVGVPVAPVQPGQPAAQAAAPGGLPSLAEVRWVGAPVSFEMFKGKSVLVLVYATWCPKCNTWSAELFAQLKEAVADKPVVVLAIDADDSPSGVQQYLTERGFFAPNVVHGYDPTMHQKLGFESNLYNYLLVGPDGKPGQRGSAGGFFETPQGKKFALPAKLAESNDLGHFEFINPDMSDEVRALFWPWELGQISETAMRAAQKRLGPDQQKQIDDAVARFLDARIELVRRNYKGSVPERIEAYETAAALSAMFRATPQSQKAREVVAFMDADQAFKRELAAKKVYEGAMQKISENPGRGSVMMRAIAQRFDGTYFGKLAAESAEGPSP